MTNGMNCEKCGKRLSVLKDRITIRLINGKEHTYCTEYIEEGFCNNEGENEYD